MIDFTNVKSITIPEGSVKKITVGSVVKWEKPEQWDGIILPYYGGETGELPVKVLDVTKGQQVTLAYYLTQRQGYVYDGRNVGLQYYGSVSSTKYPIPEDHIGSEHQVVITIASSGELVLCGYKGNTNLDGQLASGTTDRPYGRYIKYRVE